MAELTKRYGAFKLVFLGESAVGKSSIIQRFTRNVFDQYRDATIGAAFISKVFEFPDDDKKIINRVKYEIWDTAGQERYKSLTPMYYRNANVAIIVFDLTEKSSFEKAQDWIDELSLYCDGAHVHIRSADDGIDSSDTDHSNGQNNSLLIVLVGNKLDLVQKGAERATSEEDVEKFVQNKHLLYTETSAKSGENIKDLFHTVITDKLPDHAFKIEGAAEGVASLSKQTSGSYTVDLNKSLRGNQEDGSCAC